MFEIGRVEELVAERLRIECRVHAVYGRHDASGILPAILLGICGREHDAGEICTARGAKIEFGLLDCGVISTFEIVRQAEREAVDRTECGIDALGVLQGRDRGIRLS